MADILSNYWFWVWLTLYWIFMAAVDALPSLTTGSTAWYTFLYRFLHTLAANSKSGFANIIEKEKH